MKRPREKMRRLLLQQLEKRCVMDASGFEELMESTQVEETQVAEIDATAMMYKMDVSEFGVAETSALDADLSTEPVDFESADVMYFSMAGGAGTEEMDTDGLIAASAFSDDGSVDRSELERSIEDVSIQTFGTPEPGDYSIESSPFEIDYILDIDQNGLVSAVDVWMIINSINSPDTLGSGAEFDVNGDSIVSPLDVLIVINELNNAEAGVAGFAAPAVSSSRLALRINPEWIANEDDSTTANSLIAGDDLRVDESADESARLADSAFAEFDPASDDSSLDRLSSSIASYKIAPPLDETSKDESSSDTLSDSDKEGIEVDESLLMA